MSSRSCYLMCSPKYFDVSYVINPWMEGNLHRASCERASQQWESLCALIRQQAEVQLIAPQPDLPDMPFTANGGLVRGDKVVVSRFFHPERRGEEGHFSTWFAAQGYKVYRLPEHLPFEGAGDALLDEERGCLWAGWGHRSSRESHEYIARWLDVEVLSLHLVNSRFYHLDTCFCLLDGGFVLYYPPAFDEESRELIARRVPPEKRIAVSEQDAINFACNAVNICDTVILNRASEGLKRRLEGAGLRVLETDLSEFLKAGGAAKCLTLKLNAELTPGR